MAKHHGDDSTVVTISDCARAIESVEAEIRELKIQEKNVQRKIEALRTQGLLLSQLIKVM